MGLAVEGHLTGRVPAEPHDGDVEDSFRCAPIRSDDSQAHCDPSSCSALKWESISISLRSVDLMEGAREGLPCRDSVSTPAVSGCCTTRAKGFCSWAA